MWHAPPPTIPWSLLYFLDLFAIALFLISYYRNCYLRGYRIDFWHANLFLVCVLPNMLLLPFARNELNAIVLGTDMDAVVAVLPLIFLITLLGYFAVLAGGSLWRLRVGVGMRKTAIRALGVVPRCSMMLMSSRNVLVFQAALCFVLQLVILAIYFSQSGFGFNLRSFTFENPTFRPVALLISNYSIVIASHCLARYADKKERILLGCTLLLTFGLLFFGARSNLLSVYMGVLLCYLVKLRGRISIFRIVGLAVFLIAFAFYLGSLRAGQYSPAEFFASFVFLVFYGNTFSDLRDFAWVYSAWDHVFWAGKTYLAALLAFIPRFASDFRDTWGLGAVTSSTVGFDPQVHPGLRPGAFGESFFNFGLLGVVAVGLMLGLVARRVDTDVKVALAGPQPSMMKAFASSMLLGVAGSLSVSAGFSGLYVLAGIYFFSWFCICVQRMFKPRRILLDHAG
ncbi:MAG: oligosaccharide repeat unit polymerase [Candidatus Sulfotelmatobacter sp.]